MKPPNARPSSVRGRRWLGAIAAARGRASGNLHAAQRRLGRTIFAANGPRRLRERRGGPLRVVREVARQSSSTRRATHALLQIAEFFTAKADTFRHRFAVTDTDKFDVQLIIVA